MTNNCECPTPPPPSSCAPENYYFLDQSPCSNIRMFFGYDAPTGSGVKTGQLDKLYYTNQINTNSLQLGFKINDYSAQELIDSGILPVTFGKDGKFLLTETELLSTSSYESWKLFVATDVIKNGFLSGPNSRCFGFYCFQSLGIDLEAFRQYALKGFLLLSKKGDTSGFFASTLSKFRPLFNKLDPLGLIDTIYANPGQDECDTIDAAAIEQKLIICYDWLKNIHDTYYGRQFLVRVGDSIPVENTDIYKSVCIKNENNETSSFVFNQPSGILSPINYTYFIDGDGSSQGFSVSDEIASEGSYPHESATNIIGLNINNSNMTWIQDDTGKIAPFVRAGIVYDNAQTEECEDAAINKLYKYSLFFADDKCSKFAIDLSKLSEDSYYIEEENQKGILYIRCDVEQRYYINEEGTWVKITLADKIILNPLDYNPLYGIYMWIYLVKQSLAPIIRDGIDAFLNFYSDKHFGARSNRTQLNLANGNPVCLIPQAAAIPFKSNVYRYGPYAAKREPTDGGGGTEIIFQQEIAPWNFIDSTYNIGDSYNRMDTSAEELAKNYVKGLQKLEKGRVTVAGLPTYCIGHFVDNSGLYPEEKGIGPTLLTDISVEYGSGGFTTTYNFSTFSPRFGRPEKYILDSWSKNIEKTNLNNKYLREEKTKLDKNKSNLRLKYLEQSQKAGLTNQGKIITPKINNDTTPARLLYSGYFFKRDYTDFDLDSISDYPAPTGTYKSDVDCTGVICEPAYTYLPELSGKPPIHRLYTFSETHEGYTSEYIQDTYHQLSIMGLDGLYLPVSLRGANSNPLRQEFTLLTNGELQRNPLWRNSARMPRFAMRCENNGNFVDWNSPNAYDTINYNDPGYPIPSKTRDEIPPFTFKHLNAQFSETESIAYALPINQMYLNPMLSRKLLTAKSSLGVTDTSIVPWDDRKNNTTEHGFVISSIAFGQKHENYQITHTDEDINDDVSESDQIYAKNIDEIIRQQYDNFRFPALRGPLVLQGWGYDTTGKPIPNHADHYDKAELGQFRKHKLTDKFMKDWIKNPKTWPVGPIDLRFDRERGVWTCPSPNKIVVAKLKEKLSKYGKAKAYLLNPEAGGIRFYQNYSISGPNGEDIKTSLEDTEITVYDFIGIELCACDNVYVYYDDNRYIVLESNRAYKDPDEPCDSIDCTTTTTETTTTTTTETTTTPTETTTTSTEPTETPTAPTTAPPETQMPWPDAFIALKLLPSYDGSVSQSLGHDGDGNLQWFNI